MASSAVPSKRCERALFDLKFQNIAPYRVVQPLLIEWPTMTCRIASWPG